MCVAAIAWDAHPDMRLIAIGNRDEFHERPSAPLARWQDGSGIIAGRDMRAGGTWLGISEAGRFALLTNFRDREGFSSDRISRGGVVAGYLAGALPAQIDEMNAFNLFCADKDGARFVTNYPRVHTETLASGIYSLSNGPLGNPWPKSLQLRSTLGKWLSSSLTDVSSLFAALRAETPSPAGPHLMHAPAPDYAPVFIRNPVYGTRCSTVVTIDRDGKGTIIERSFNPDGNETGEISLDFRWPCQDRNGGTSDS